VERNQRRVHGISDFPWTTVAALLACAVVVSWGPYVGARVVQDALVSSPSQESAARFLVQSDLVLIPVTVLTGDGRAVPGLRREHFSVFDNRLPQVITHFASEDAPVTIGLVFDTSSSMERRLAKAQEAVYALLQNAHSDDDFFLIRFSNHPELAVRLTNETAQVRRAVQSLHAHGSTALLDAMNMAWLEMSKARHTRKAIILLSDGEDNCSRLTPAEFKQLAAENATTIYGLFMGALPAQPNPWTKLTGVGLLDDIARQTGGETLVVSKLKQLPEIAARIGSWIRSQYVLGYAPAPESRNGGYHRIRVKVSKPAGFPRLHPAWRLSYYVPNS
jgi:Ca-activated chloride channel family protein